MNFNINDLKKIQNDKNENRKKVFIIVLEQCIKRIKYINKNSNATDFWYIVPKIIVGQPLFNIEKCCEFLLEELNILGFKTTFISPDRINISWNNINDSIEYNKIDKTSDSDFNILDGLNFNYK
jgi:hypothetical protein